MKSTLLGALGDQPSADLSSSLAAVAAAVAHEEQSVAPSGLSSSTAGDRHDHESGPVRWVMPIGSQGVTCYRYPMMHSLRATTNFATISAAVSLIRGKWMYEVTLLSEGLCQIGWNGPHHAFPFSSRLGVGDFPFSYAYDGQRQRLWNVQTVPTGTRWAPGDVVTCLLDLDEGKMTYLHNGIEACSRDIPTVKDPGVKPDPILSYSPTLSLTQHENCTANLGESPFFHPQEGFSPINDFRPCHNKWRKRVEAIIELASSDDSQSGVGVEATLPLVAQLVGQLDETHDVGGATIAFAELLATSRPSTVGKAFDALETVLDDSTYNQLVGCILSTLAFLSSTTLPDPEAPQPSQPLRVIVAAVKSSSVRKAWMKSSSVTVDLLNLCRIKAPNNSDLAQKLFPLPEQEDGDAEIDIPSMVERARKMHEGTIAVDDTARSAILDALLEDHAGRQQVLGVMDACIKEFKERPGRQLVQARSSPLCIDNAVVARLFFVGCGILVKDVNKLTSGLPSEEKVGEALATRYMPPSLLASQSIEGLSINRVGGGFSHLSRRQPLNTSDSSHHDSLILKLCVLYTLAVKDRVMTACNYLMMQQRLRQGFVMRGDSPSLEDIARAASWDAATLFYCGSNPNLVELAGTLVRIVNHYFGKPEFAYLPVIVIECFVDVLHFARKTSLNYSRLIAKQPQCIQFFVQKFLHTSIANNETSEYMMLSLGSIIDSVEEHRSTVVTILEREPEQWMRLLMLTLNHFSHRIAWTLVVGILVRFNIGNGFNMIDLEEEQIDWSVIFPQRGKAVEEHVAFKFYREAFRKYIEDGPWRTNNDADVNGSPKKFFSDLMDHVNWSLSELGASLAEIKVSGGTENTETLGNTEMNRRRRCVSLFDLCRKLLHILEFFIDVSYDLFFDGASSDTDKAEDYGDASMNTSMVVEAVTQAFARFSSKLDTNHLVRISSQKPHGMERIHQWKLIAPLVGILHNMCRGGQNIELGKNPFLDEMARSGVEWDLESIEHALTGFDWSCVGAGFNGDKTEFVRNPVLLERLRDIHNLHTRGTKLDDDDDGLVEDGLCLICAIAKIDTSFDPCQHQSCRACIRRHLMNSDKCFFCNKKIDKLVALDPDVQQIASA